MLSSAAPVCDEMAKDLFKTFGLVLTLAASAFAQATQPSIWIGVSLHLGMPRDAIITELSENYHVTKMHIEGDEWIVAEKNSPETWVGHLGFHSGKLTYASRAWTQALWGVMSQTKSEGHRSCLFDVPTTRSPTAEVRYVRLYCGAKRIEITITNVLNGEGKGQLVSIDEVLSSESNR